MPLSEKIADLRGSNALTVRDREIFEAIVAEYQARVECAASAVPKDLVALNGKRYASLADTTLEFKPSDYRTWTAAVSLKHGGVHAR